MLPEAGDIASARQKQSLDSNVFSQLGYGRCKLQSGEDSSGAAARTAFPVPRRMPRRRLEMSHF